MRSLLRSIGGEFPVTCQDFVVKEQQGTGAWPEYAGKQHLRCDSGRSALLLALRHWQRENAFCKVVWLPSYLCPSIPNTVYQAGLRVCIYEDGPGEALPFMPPTPLDGDLVLIVHYFGHVNTRALDWLSREPLRNWGVIEDCVQTPYSVGVGDAGNYVITSMRKWWPAPDGATLHFQGELWAPFMLESDEGFVSRSLLAKMLRPFGGEAEARHLVLLAEAEARLDESVAARQVSWVSETLLVTADRYSMSQQRRQNWMRLAATMPNISQWGTALRPLYTSLAADAVPMAFPLCVDVQHRDRLRSQLASLRIFCPIHWNISESAQGAAADLARSMISLPVDQRYGD
jgi:hypothetical protein